MATMVAAGRVHATSTRTCTLARNTVDGADVDTVHLCTDPDHTPDPMQGTGWHQPNLPCT